MNNINAFVVQNTHLSLKDFYTKATENSPKIVLFALAIIASLASIFLLYRFLTKKVTPPLRKSPSQKSHHQKEHPSTEKPKPPITKPAKGPLSTNEQGSSKSQKAPTFSSGTKSVEMSDEELAKDLQRQEDGQGGFSENRSVSKKTDLPPDMSLNSSSDKGENPKVKHKDPAELSDPPKKIPMNGDSTLPSTNLDTMIGGASNSHRTSLRSTFDKTPHLLNSKQLNELLLTCIKEHDKAWIKKLFVYFKSSGLKIDPLLISPQQIYLLTALDINLCEQLFDYQPEMFNESQISVLFNIIIDEDNNAFKKKILYYINKSKIKLSPYLLQEHPSCVDLSLSRQDYETLRILLSTQSQVFRPNQLIQLFEKSFGSGNVALRDQIFNCFQQVGGFDCAVSAKKFYDILNLNNDLPNLHKLFAIYTPLFNKNEITELLKLAIKIKEKNLINTLIGQIRTHKISLDLISGASMIQELHLAKDYENSRLLLDIQPNLFNSQQKAELLKDAILKND